MAHYTQKLLLIQTISEYFCFNLDGFGTSHENLPYILTEYVLSLCMKMLFKS